MIVRKVAKGCVGDAIWARGSLFLDVVEGSEKFEEAEGRINSLSSASFWGRQCRGKRGRSSDGVKVCKDVVCQIFGGLLIATKKFDEGAPRLRLAEQSSEDLPEARRVKIAIHVVAGVQPVLCGEGVSIVFSFLGDVLNGFFESFICFVFLPAVD